jgi:hypothetical protein
LALAEAQVEDSRRARDDTPQPSAEQVKAADEVAASERAVAAARVANALPQGNTSLQGQ